MAGTNRKKENTKYGFSVILVSPQLPENIGMTARAMANFGLSDLRIINPREKFPSAKAYSAASKADYIINEASVYNNLEFCLKDFDYILATTARQRDNYKIVLSPVEAMQECKYRMDNQQKVAVMFGAERTGLLNEQISLADKIVTFPVNPAYGSLNLSQAVLLMGYEWMKANMQNPDKPIFKSENLKLASKNNLYSFFHQLEHALEVRGYFRPLERKKIMIENLREVITRAQFSEEELNLFRGVIASLDRYTPKGSLKNE